MKVFKGRLLRMPNKDNLVIFRDHSDDFSSGSSRKRKRPISLPSLKYVSIHATLAGVMNMSGAGKFFDELLDKYKDNEGEVPLSQSWTELENIMEEEILRESVVELFRKKNLTVLLLANVSTSTKTISPQYSYRTLQ